MKPNLYRQLQLTHLEEVLPVVFEQARAHTWT